jgi:Domain of unknown function (DUF4159)
MKNKTLRTFNPIIIILIVTVLSAVAIAETSNPSSVQIARLKYFGGGDWYWGPSALPNLIDYVNKNTPIQIASEEVRLTLTDDLLFHYPFLYLTGHGPIRFSEEDEIRLRLYLSSGGFLFANDSYGLKKSFMESMKRVFPDIEVVELPFSYGMFNCYYNFPNGLPKIHKHDEKPPQAFGWFLDGRLVVLLAYESDIGDGWEDPAVHHDPPAKREAALKMGVNILTWVLLN